MSNVKLELALKKTLVCCNILEAFNSKLIHLCFSTGASALVLPPDPVFPCDLGEVDGLHKRDAVLDDLHQKILRFIYAYAPGADAFITEE